MVTPILPVTSQAVPRSSLREGLSRLMGDWLLITTTSDGAGDGSTFISSQLLQQLTGSLIHFYARVSIGASANVGVTRQISLFNRTTGVVTLITPFPAQIQANSYVEIHRYDPNQKDDFLNKAGRDLFDRGLSRSISVRQPFGDLIRGGDMEQWSPQGLPYGWNLSTGVVTKTHAYRDGRWGCQLTADPTFGGGIIEQDIIPNRHLAGRTITLTTDVYATTNAPNARIAIVNGTTVTNSVNYSGGGNWQTLTISIVVPTPPILLQVRLEVQTAALQATFDKIRMALDYNNYTGTTIIPIHPMFLRPADVRFYKVSNPIGVTDVDNEQSELLNGGTLHDEGGMFYKTFPMRNPVTTADILYDVVQEGVVPITWALNDQDLIEVQPPWDRALYHTAAYMLFFAKLHGSESDIGIRGDWEKLAQTHFQQADLAIKLHNTTKTVKRWTGWVRQ